MSQEQNIPPSAEELLKEMESNPRLAVKNLKRIEETPEYTTAFAVSFASPTMQAAETFMAYKHEEEPLDYVEIATELDRQTQAVRANVMGRIEDILVAQAHTLDLLFHKQLRKAAGQKYLDHLKVHMDFAFKAQRQCRATLETLAAIKNPQPIAFIRQQNIAENQQVNNGIPAPARGENSETTNGLLEDHSNEWLDTRAPGAAGGVNQDLEAVGAQHRAAD